MRSASGSAIADVLAIDHAAGLDGEERKGERALIERLARVERPAARMEICPVALQEIAVRLSYR
jgi:hypothetical protein